MRTIAFVVCLAAVAHADNSTPAGKDGNDDKDNKGEKVRVLATLERTMCYGTCPVYKLTIFSDGRVEWDGDDFVKVKGKASARLSAGELAALKTAFSDAKYLELGEGYDCREVTDHPSANTSYDDGTRKKAISHYHGCRSKAGVQTLSALEAKIDQIAKTERWIGTKDERRTR